MVRTYDQEDSPALDEISREAFVHDPLCCMNIQRGQDLHSNTISFQHLSSQNLECRETYIVQEDDLGRRVNSPSQRDASLHIPHH